MTRQSVRLLLPSLALLILSLLSPTLATAFPQGATLRSAVERSSTAPGLFARVWDLLSAFWMTGSILEPNGSTDDTGSGLDPNGLTGDTGSILDPNG